MPKINVNPSLKPMSTEESTVWILLKGITMPSSPKYKYPRLTQLQIARFIANLGPHQKWENAQSKNTTTRRVRQIIRNLKTKHYCPILGDRDGYWVSDNPSEIREAKERVEKVRRAQIAAYNETIQSYNHMLENVQPD